MTQTSTTPNAECDVLIVGCGVSGLFCALTLPRELNVQMICKTTVDECDSMLAQGGICVLVDDDDYDGYFEDTLRAGHYENRRESVDIMLRRSRHVIDRLLEYGVDFERNEDGSLAFTREGAHGRARICYHADTTGAEITTRLLDAVRELPNVRIFEHTPMTDLLIEDDACHGIIATVDGAEQELRARATMLACGGVGGLWERSTNFPSLTGDGIEACRRHGIELENVDYVQIHPTSLVSDRPGRAFLISESCRGEGAVLRNSAGERFTDELQPRDVVTGAIKAEMKRTGASHVWLDFSNVGRDVICNHFPAIRARCLEDGYDICEEPIPVAPAQHYLMGGIHVDRRSHTTCPHLWAAGETSCNGVHGKNRLASNSLLESLVFAEIAALDIAKELAS